MEALAGAAFSSLIGNLESAEGQKSSRWDDSCSSSSQDCSEFNNSLQSGASLSSAVLQVEGFAAAI